MKPRKIAVQGRVVKLLSHRCDRRQLRLDFGSRCVRAGDVHEMITTTDPHIKLGETIDAVGFLAFVEITSAGVIEFGDSVEVGGRRVGAVIGFDGSHWPNHLNIIIRAPRIVTAPDMDLELLEAVRFQETAPRQG
jgi:hypothetical protein